MAAQHPPAGRAAWGREGPLRGADVGQGGPIGRSPTGRPAQRRLVPRLLPTRGAALLLVALGLQQVEGRCVFNRTQEFCLCYRLTEQSAGSVIQCLAASTVEFQGGDLEKYADFPVQELDDSTIDMLGTLEIRKIIFSDLVVPEVLLARVLRFFSYTRVQEMVFESCSFVGRSSWADMDGRILPIVSLRFHNVTAPELRGRELDLSPLGRWLGALRELSVTASRLDALPCALGRALGALRSLDLARNSLGDAGLAAALCRGSFPQLRVLSLQHNNLTSFRAVCGTVGLLGELRHLDLSHNALSAGTASSSCRWPDTLRVLNLSSAGLDQVLTPLPPDLEVLDLSSNRLRTVAVSLRSLRALFLSHNALPAAPSVRGCPALLTLHVDNNLIAELPRDVGNLRDVTAAGNPFNCSCSGAGAVQALAAAGCLGRGWPQGYVCRAPARYRGVMLRDVPTSVLQCSPAAVLAPVCTVLALLCVAAGLLWCRGVRPRCQRGPGRGQDDCGSAERL
ncbi:monocyte differentiation antigen CD14 [Coturnix japonica]|uniref:Monocyte differentiation antigen CD14 n=1 Tax=Coturnix japonica TaxID=93934 RepID=A0A8C2YBL9_COTJA|nr:monocyte differentiation antigen CD14 [Coturnix japonica]